MATTTGECRRGHPLAVLGRNKVGRCVACRRFNDAKRDAVRNASPERKEYMAQYRVTWNGQLSEFRHGIRKRIDYANRRLAELEAQLQ